MLNSIICYYDFWIMLTVYVQDCNKQICIELKSFYLFHAYTMPHVKSIICWLNKRNINYQKMLDLYHLQHLKRYFLKAFYGSRKANRCINFICPTLRNGPLTRCVELRVAHAPEFPGTFPPPPRVSDPDMHHGTYVTHVPWCMSGSLTSGFLWSRWRGKSSRHSRRMRNPQIYESGKKFMVYQTFVTNRGCSGVICHLDPWHLMAWWTRGRHIIEILSQLIGNK